MSDIIFHDRFLRSFVALRTPMVRNPRIYYLLEPVTPLCLERIVPRFVEHDLRSFLDCGILERGFVRVHCDACGKDLAVPYSCKRRSFCPSRGGRRMAETAAHLVDHVFPEVPIRQ